MAARVVRLGTERLADEGLGIGPVRRPPRGVRKSDYAARDWFDVWLPNLAPSPEAVKLAQHASTERDWTVFLKTYRSEMAAPDTSRLLDLLAALSHQTNFSVGCYCADESRCHRSVLRQLLAERDAKVK